MASQDGKIRKEDLVSNDALKVYSDLQSKATTALKAIVVEMDKLADAQAKIGITTKQSTTNQTKRNTKLTEAQKIINQTKAAEEKLK